MFDDFFWLLLWISTKMSASFTVFTKKARKFAKNLRRRFQNYFFLDFSAFSWIAAHKNHQKSSKNQKWNPSRDFFENHKNSRCPFHFWFFRYFCWFFWAGIHENQQKSQKIDESALDSAFFLIFQDDVTAFRRRSTFTLRLWSNFWRQGTASWCFWLADIEAKWVFPWFLKKAWRLGDGFVPWSDGFGRLGDGLVTALFLEVTALAVF